MTGWCSMVHSVYYYITLLMILFFYMPHTPTNLQRNKFFYLFCGFASWWTETAIMWSSWEKSLTGGTILSVVKTFATCHTALDRGEFVYIVWWLILWGLWQEQEWKCHVMWDKLDVVCAVYNHKKLNTWVSHRHSPHLMCLYQFYIHCFLFCCVWCTNLTFLVLFPWIIFCQWPEKV